MPSQINKSPSKMERKCQFLLETADILYLTEFSFDDLRSGFGHPLRFDFAVFETMEDMNAENPQGLIELQGQQHYEKCFTTAEQFRRQQANDHRKVSYCRGKNIPLLVVPYSDYNNMTVDYILNGLHWFDF